MKNYNYRFRVSSVDQMDPVSKLVYDGLCKGVDKRVLSNKYDMPITTVIAISKHFNTGQISKQKKEETKEKDTMIENNIIEEVHEEVNTPNITEEEIKVVKPKNVSKSKKKAKRKKRAILSDEDIATIIELCADENNKNTDIAKAADVSLSTVSRLKKLYRKEIEALKNKNIVPVQEEKDNTTEELQHIGCNTSISVGLVAERHDIPVDEYIFKNHITKKLMFDYDRIDTMIREYIEDNIQFENGYAKQSLTVYVTGIQCVLSSLIKVTNEMKVNLVLRHFNSDNNTYSRQVIWDQFKQPIPGVINDLLANSTDSYTYNCNVDELYENKKLVRIIKEYYKEGSLYNIDHFEVILTKDIEDAFKIMKSQIDSAEDKSGKLVLTAKEYKYEDNDFKETGMSFTFKTKE